MPRLEYFLVCESVSVDQSTNRISLFNVLEEVTLVGGDEESPGLPLSQFVVVTCWNQEEGDADQAFEASIRVASPGEENPQPAPPLRFRMTQRRKRLLFYGRGLSANAPGHISFELLLNGQRQATHTVFVSPADSQSGDEE